MNFSPSARSPAQLSDELAQAMSRHMISGEAPRMWIHGSSIDQVANGVFAAVRGAYDPELAHAHEGRGKGTVCSATREDESPLSDEIGR
jgi:hypothetical protein